MGLKIGIYIYMLNQFLSKCTLGFSSVSTLLEQKYLYSRFQCYKIHMSILVKKCESKCNKSICNVKVEEKLGMTTFS